MKKYLDNDGLINLYKIIVNKIDDKITAAFEDFKASKLPPPEICALTFEALEDGAFSIVKKGDPIGSVSYSLDNGATWKELSNRTPIVKAGQRVMWKGDYRGTSSTDCIQFRSTCKFKVSGNIMSLIFGDNFEDKTDLTDYIYCFCYLFRNCLNLVDASNLILPATTLANSCYASMFSGCNYLTSAPQILPATTLAEGCYQNMFQNCYSLTTAPELPATTLTKNSCYVGMFMNCTNLNYIKAMFTTTPSSSYTLNWVSGVASTGTFVKNPDATWDVTGNSGVPTGWDIVVPNYLSFEALEAGTFSFTETGISAATGGISYSLDNGATWTSPTYSASTPTVSTGQRVMWKGDYRGLDKSNCVQFSSTCKFKVSGNIMSLIFGDNFEDKTDLTNCNYCFCYLFYNCSHLVDASNLILPATTLAEGCYQNMFYGCNSLTTAPVLPATTLAMQCYDSMFHGCSSLTAAPELPATTLAVSCYINMFHGCSSLTTAPVLPATTLARSCYSSMFSGCNSLTTAPVLPATTLASSCYNNMFYNCTSLTTAPELPATTLERSCYTSMFYNCTNLNYIKAMFTTTPSGQYTSSWVRGVSSTGTFVKNAAATWDVTGTQGVPTGWTVETATA